MSFWYSDAADDRPQSVATGEAPLFEILTAAREQMRLVENSTAAGEALTRAYDQRIRDIEAATGETYQNPMRVDLQTQVFEQKRNPTYSFETGNETREAKIAGAIDGFNTWLADVAKRHPDKAAVIAVDRPVERDAEGLARHADERLAKAVASREGLGKWAALLAGGVAGAGYDPLQVASMFAGGGPGAARTIGGRILAVTAKEAAVNALAEAVQQPQVQAWRKQAGLPNGMEEAVKNVAFAGLLGGALGGAGQGVAEGIGRFWRVADLDTDAAARVLADAPDANPSLKAAIDGDARAAADLLRPIRDTLPAEARGAIDALDAARMADVVRPPAASPRVHDDVMAAAMRAAQRSELFTHEPDPAQVSRIVDQLVPQTVTATVKGKAGTGETDLAEFLMRAGGVKDFKGELDAIGATKISRRFVGRLVREDGMPLDQARLRAAEAGYFDRLYGTPDAAAEKSTIADLLDALDSGAREDARIRIEDDGGRAYAEELVYELTARAGPAVDDRLILQAAELANAERIAPAEALDRVLIADDLARDAFANAPVPPAGRDPAKPAYVDTRGIGTRFHGSRTGLPDGPLDPNYSSALNYYGQGLYTTDAIAIADGYANGNRGRIYTMTEVAPVNAFDMEGPIPDWLVDADDALAMFAIQEHKPKTVRELYDAIRETGTADGLSADAIQEIFDSLRYRFEEQGFNALDHIGGLKTANAPHSVRIYFDPDVLAVEKATVDDYLAAMPMQQSRPSRLDPSDMRGGLNDPLGFPDEDVFSRADLEDLPEDMDIPFFDDEPPIGRDALIEHLDNLDHLTAVVEACRA